MGHKDICGFGTVSVDTLIPLDHIPAIDESMFVSEMVEQAGGVVAVAMITASKLGSSVGFAGVLGEDQQADVALSALKQGGVDVSCCRTYPGRTSRAAILIDGETKKRSILYHPGVSLGIKPDQLDFSYLLDCNILHLDGLAFEAAQELATRAKERGVLVSLDAGAMTPGMDELMSLADILIPNEEVAKEATGIEDPVRACTKLLSGGKEAVAITLGDRGAIAMTSDGHPVHQPSFRVDLKDTTGAGDSFHGAFLHGYAQGWPLTQILKSACAVAALVCTELGGHRGTPFSDTLESFLKEGDSG